MQDQDKDADRSSDFWRERADEARAHAEHMTSSDGNSWMLEIP